MHKLVLTAALLSFMSTGCVMYAPARGIPDGTIETRLTGAVFYGDTSTDDLADNFRFDLAAIYGVNDRLQIGPMLEWGIGEVEAGGIQLVDREMVNYGIQCVYSFQPHAQVTPYGLLNFGITDVDSDNGFIKSSDDGIFVAVGVGLRSQINRRFAVHGEFRITHRDLDRSVGGDWEEASVFLGFSYVFGNQDRSAVEEDVEKPNPWRQPGEVIREHGNTPKRDAERLWHR